MAKSKLASIRPIQVRMPEGLRRHLEAGARRKGHSMNSEIVGRLEQSFADEDRFVEMLGGEHTASVFKVLAAIIRHVETANGKRWIDDQSVKHQALTAAYATFTGLLEPDHQDVAWYGNWMDALDDLELLRSAAKANIPTVHRGETHTVTYRVPTLEERERDRLKAVIKDAEKRTELLNRRREEAEQELAQLKGKQD